ncbi:MAG: nicotinate (nicotinamide) nucleotide adenylyltransferase [Calditrichaceae bacterium]|nr:nicotinate (nicotinamide) nucleotide adenylyltransferase [Calditrichaceae bacterium]MBN2709036.1 nicotinate (nicotinamide) nucleotide adenylyltransferase [Calditrichaceae bacterium]RQV96995.1 MAG: nicotinate (nicotinamide) nucleotide adenylyltransferase [Calditrichota bacterium]
MADYPHRIGLFGGTFDPLHNGHLILAEWSLDALKLDRFIFIPNNIHPFSSKSDITSTEHRLKMLTAAIADYDRFCLDDYEIKKDKISYTIDTLRYFKKKWPEAQLIYLIGADNMALFDQWKDYKLLPDLAEFKVFRRNPEEPVRNENSRFNFEILDNPVIQLSSTFLRNRIKNNLSCKSMIPDSAWIHIVNHHLYTGQ